MNSLVIFLCELRQEISAVYNEFLARCNRKFSPPENLPPRGGRFPRKFSPHPENLPPRGVNFPRKIHPPGVKTVLRVKTANLPPDRGYWHFIRKKIIGGYKFLRKLPPRGYKFLGKLPPGGYKFLGKPPPRGVNFPRKFSPPGGKSS